MEYGLDDRHDPAFARAPEAPVRIQEPEGFFRGKRRIGAANQDYGFGQRVMDHPDHRPRRQKVGFIHRKPDQNGAMILKIIRNRLQPRIATGKVLPGMNPGAMQHGAEKGRPEMLWEIPYRASRRQDEQNRDRSGAFHRCLLQVAADGLTDDPAIWRCLFLNSSQMVY